MFSYDLILGDKERVLADKNAIVLSEKLAVNLFGSMEGVVGKVVQLDHKMPYQVAGVFKDVPFNASAQFDYVLPYEIFKESNDLTAKWDFSTVTTYLVLNEGTDRAKLDAKIAGFVKRRVPESNATLLLQTYPTFYLTGFNTALVLKGKINSTFGEMLTRKGLVVFQFTMSIVLIISVMLVYKQIDFLQSKNLGYDRENIIHLPIEGKVAENLDTFSCRNPETTRRGGGIEHGGKYGRWQQ